MSVVAALTAGIRLGVYEIVAPLGKGLRRRYEAHDMRLDRRVAIKVLFLVNIATEPVSPQPMPLLLLQLPLRVRFVWSGPPWQAPSFGMSHVDFRKSISCRLTISGCSS